MPTNRCPVIVTESGQCTLEAGHGRHGERDCIPPWRAERPSIEDEWYEQDSGGGDDSAKGADETPAQVVTSLPRPSSGCRHQWTHIGGYPDEPEELAYDKCLKCQKVKGLR